MTLPMPAISISCLSKSCGEAVLLHPLTLDIPMGEVFGLVGPDGAGRATVIRLLMTRLAPSGGTARIAGHDIAADPVRVRSAIGYLPESVRFDDRLTALENLIIFARVSGAVSPALAALAALCFLDIAGLADRQVGTLSKGMRLRVGLARAILHNPHVLFLDASPPGVDPAEARQLCDMIEMLGTTGMTVVINAALRSEMMRSCTSVGVLAHGRLVLHDTVEAVAARSRAGPDQPIRATM